MSHKINSPHIENLLSVDLFKTFGQNLHINIKFHILPLINIKQGVYKIIKFFSLATHFKRLNFTLLISKKIFFYLSVNYNRNRSIKNCVLISLLNLVIKRKIILDIL